MTEPMFSAPTGSTLPPLPGKTGPREIISGACSRVIELLSALHHSEGYVSLYRASEDQSL